MYRRITTITTHMTDKIDKIDKKTIVVWFSCGAASAVAAKKTIELYSSTHFIRVVNNPIANEDPDNQRFLKDVEQWIGIPIESAINPKYPSTDCQDVWNDRKYMSGIAGAPCTQELKKKARQHWENNNHYDYLVLGFTADKKEIKRSQNFTLTERPNLIPVLINQKITKADCYRIITEAGLTLPNIYHLGYPNANCIGCVKATSPTYWNHVRKVHPHIFKERSDFSRSIGCRLVRHKGKRIFLDELPEDATGAPLASMDVECGIFCEMQ